MGADLGHDAGLGLGGHGVAAVFLGDLHAEETVFGHEGEQFVWQFAGARQGVAVGHFKQLFHRAIDIGLFVFRQLVVVFGEDFFKIHFAAEELAVDPDVTGFQCLALGVGNLWQDLVIPHPVHQ